MADKYTWDDIIINPNDKRLEGAIGKEVYFDSFPLKCLNKANQNEDPRELLSISSLKQSITPFNVRFEAINTVCIILKKDQPQKSYAERQTEWIKENDIKVWDKVKVVRLWTDEDAAREKCISRGAVPDYICGLEGKVLEINDNSVGVKFVDDRWWFPYFVLEKVTYKYVPFDLSDPEVRKSLRGRWIIAKNGNEEWRINRFNVFEEHKGTWTVNGMSTEYLFNNYIFDDGTPCGKEIWE